jgi:beta-carotene 3-hydroxylase
MRSRELAVAAGAAIAMEPVAALMHRLVMHRRGWAWHRSHHAGPAGAVQANDRYPALFAVGTMGVMAVGSALPRLRVLIAVGSGVTVYGVAYALVHDVCIHGRLTGRSFVRGRYLHAVAAAHREHHSSNGAPYGFLAPLTGRDAWPPPRAGRVHADATTNSFSTVGTRARLEKTS